eukprot:CAMPEP_0206555928 /NCGR_PEP_ID=MMETSP0325_2-20121206/18112_1 /ASSEMBLY_ACC=CAM_ASM_000347 /TAXON_ID=2866 /ORGANISM="Crypthecodinium cohnii, Strain Seligo" /LENGTH=131 /DNA_ID=CAMNT_0054056375 /DNA_START=311 /DNA_END=707 /DNA_ORIENTATION=+
MWDHFRRVPALAADGAHRARRGSSWLTAPTTAEDGPEVARLELFGVDEALRPLADWLCCLPPRREPAFSSRSAAQTERRSSSEEIEEAVEFPPLPPPVVLLETLPERLLRRSVEEDLPCLSRCRLLGGVPL